MTIYSMYLTDATATRTASSVTKTTRRRSVSAITTPWAIIVSSAFLCITTGHGKPDPLFHFQRGHQMSAKVSFYFVP